MPIRKKPITPEEARLKMASLCSRSEQCEYDIRHKLINMGLSSSQMSEIISFLREEKFIDNARYAKSFANDKAKFSRWGPFKIKAALVAKHIPSSLINEALACINEEIWEDSVLKNATAKAKSLDLLIPGEDGYNNRKKLFEFLIGRGFQSSLANKAVKIMKNRQEEENK